MGDGTPGWYPKEADPRPVRSRVSDRPSLLPRTSENATYEKCARARRAPPAGRLQQRSLFVASALDLLGVFRQSLDAQQLQP